MQSQSRPAGAQPSEPACLSVCWLCTLGPTSAAAHALFLVWTCPWPRMLADRLWLPQRTTTAGRHGPAAVLCMHTFCPVETRVQNVHVAAAVYRQLRAPRSACTLAPRRARMAAWPSHVQPAAVLVSFWEGPGRPGQAACTCETTHGRPATASLRHGCRLAHDTCA